MALENTEIKTIMDIMRRATSDECAAIAQRFNTQALLLVNKAEKRISQIQYSADDEDQA